MSGRRMTIAALTGVAVVGAGLFGLQRARSREAAASSAPPYRLAVLGDSDSHSYRDHVQGVRRGGEHHDVAYQWTEILAATRADHLDMGAADVWGSRGIVARTRARLGLEAKTPRKYDFRWNYARSGARCTSLNSAWPDQTRWLVSALRAEPEAWANGIVVIKIGVNDIGRRPYLERYAATGVTATEEQLIAACAREIRTSIRRIRAASDAVRIVVVGVADDSSWPPETTPHRTAEEIARIRAVLDRFDDSLRAAIAGEANVAFMDDRAWYYDHFADRDSAGNPQLSSLSLGGRTAITNTQGDAPHNLMLADGHAGTVANGLWARRLIDTLRERFDIEIPQLTDAEIARLADPRGAYGIAP